VATVAVAAAVYPVTSASADLLPLSKEFVDSNASAVSHQFLNLETMPSAFSAITLSFGGHSCFPSLEAGMADPGQFNAVLDWAFLTMVLMYTLIASVGYGVFGDETQSPVLSNLPVEGGLATVVCLVKLVVALSVFCSYPILMNVMVLELEEALNVRSPGSTADAGNGDTGESTATQAVGTGQGQGLWQRQRRQYLVRRTILRSCCVGVTAVIAVLVPFFMEMMGLIGSCCLGVIVFILPVLFDWRLRMLQRAVIERWRWASGGVIIVTGLVGGGIGAVQSIQAIYDNL